MAILKRLLCHRFVVRFCFAALISVTHICGLCSAKAGPITFRFDTKISNVIMKGTQPRAFPADIGDPISGIFTFQPVDLDTSPEHPAGQFVTYEQSFPAFYRVGQVGVTVPLLVFQSRDDSAAIDSGALSDLLFSAF